MKEPHNPTHEQAVTRALATHATSLSPNPEAFRVLLSHIPEKQTTTPLTRVRSPYVWLAVTQLVIACSLVVSFYPNLHDQYLYRNNPFYATDQQVESFEISLQQEDDATMMLDYTNNLL